jgi:hypothetical protein
MLCRTIMMLGVCAGTAMTCQGNDNCATPTLAIAGVTITGNTSTSTPSVGIPSSHCAGASETGKDDWYAFTAVNSGNHTFAMCGSAYDTALSLWAACPDGTLTPFACDDDSDCGSTSIITASLTSGQAILVRVGGYNANAGAYSLLISEPPPAPSNDNCADALVIGEGSFNGNTASANRDGNSSCGNSGAAADVWYRFMVPSDAVYQFDTCASIGYDSVLALYSSCGGTEIACNDDGGEACSFSSLRSQIRQALTAGQEVTIRVSGYQSGYVGPFVLNVNEYNPPAPSNDLCENAIVVTNGANQSSSSSGANDDGLTLSLCSNFTLYNSVFFRYTATCDGDVTVATCASGFDTLIAVYDACNGTLLACNDDVCGLGSAVGLVGVVGTEYVIAVGGITSVTEGSINLTISCDVPPCAPDFNQDGFLDFFDYDAYVACFEGDIDSCPNGDELDADFNGDGFVDFFDYDDFVAAFEVGC